MSSYAQRTHVSVGNSRAEIERTLKRFGAEDAVCIEWQGRAAVVFKFHGKLMRMAFELPSHVRTPKGRKPHNEDKALETAIRETWRRLLLRVKGKVATISDSVEEFEIEFQPYIVMPDGRTLGEIMQPQIDEAYRTGRMPSSPFLMLGPGKTEN